MRSFTKNLLLKGLALIMAISTVSCTLSEPEVPTGNADSMRLTGMTVSVLNVLKVKYDNVDRITEINFANECVYLLTYEGDETIPSKIVMNEYDSFDVNDKEVIKLVANYIWTDIKADAQGHIVQYNADETEYHYNTQYDENDKQVLVQDRIEKDHGISSFTYDAKGHLLMSHYWAPDDEADGDYNYLNWSGNLITSYGEPAGASNREWTEVEYSDVVNRNLQWDPNNEILGPLAITGFFGVAPEKFIKRVTRYYNGEFNGWIEYAYSLLPNGLINKCRVADSDNEKMTYNLIYEMKK